MGSIATNLLLWLVFTTLTTTEAILTNFDNINDITRESSFGCQWLGGSSGGVVNCTCTNNNKEMVIQDGSFESYSIFGIEIQDCQRVTFTSNSIQQYRSLRHITLRNIHSLQLEESSLYWHGYTEDINYDEYYAPDTPFLAVVIENSNIIKLGSFTFKGHLGEISMKNVNIESLNTYAFTSLKQTQKILLQNVHINNINLDAFKKLSTVSLVLDNVTTAVIPSRTFSQVSVYKSLVITNCKFKAVRSGGFMIQNPQSTEVSNTYINQVDGEAFSILSNGKVLFKNNVFDTVNDFAFSEIKPNPDKISSNMYLTLDSNVFLLLTRDSLTINEGMTPKFQNLKIDAVCDCKYIDHNLKYKEFYSEIKCRHPDQYTSVADFKSSNCNFITTHATTAIIVLIVVVLVIIVTLGFIVYYKRVYLVKKYNNEKMAKQGDFSLIVPDGRTYRETELHVIVERADLLTTDL